MENKAIMLKGNSPRTTILWIGCLLIALIAFPTAALADVSPYGAFQTSVPIEVPPYHGLEPRLNLAYNSSAGNGWLGVGWDLSGVSSIERASPGRGVPNYNNSDIFFLDGMELVLCTSNSISPSCTTAKSAFGSSNGFYSTKIESFMRIHYNPNNPPTGIWNVVQKNGIRVIYEEYFLTPKGTYRWLLSKVKDTSGNTVNYNYWKDGPYEVYLDKISYNGMVIKFYWEVRPDPIPYAIGSGMATIRHRLKTIDVTVSGSRARVYKLTYMTSVETSRSLLQSVQQFGHDSKVNCGTASTDTCDASRPKGNITNENTASKFPSFVFSPAPAGQGTGTWTSESRNPFTGDRPKISPSIYSNPPGAWETGWNVEPSDTNCGTGDVDGDGQSDFICVTMHKPHDNINYNHVVVHVATPPTLVRNLSRRTTHSTVRWNGGVMTTGDFDGDGKIDILLFDEHPISSCSITSGKDCGHITLQVLLSNGDGTFRHEPTFYTDTQWEVMIYPFINYVPTIGDVNADGKSDIIVFGIFGRHQSDDTQMIYSAISKGHRFEMRQALRFALSERVGGIGDVNGDGRTDVILMLDHGPHDNKTNKHFAI